VNNFYPFLIFGHANARRHGETLDIAHRSQADLLKLSPYLKKLQEDVLKCLAPWIFPIL